ncbi:MAG: hypothetical protein O3A39_01165 [Proteobacteria bacterium]|nr:hypothetical protein [Pseudomonadota bacterium]MDA1134880.1 hypothetical protein [Pseudomonadota bacterium]
MVLIQFLWLNPNKKHVVFDMAPASMAKGEVMIAARDGHIFSVGVW